MTKHWTNKTKKAENNQVFRFRNYLQTYVD